MALQSSERSEYENAICKLLKQFVSISLVHHILHTIFLCTWSVELPAVHYSYLHTQHALNHA